MSERDQLLRQKIVSTLNLQAKNSRPVYRRPHLLYTAPPAAEDAALKVLANRASAHLLQVEVEAHMSHDPTKVVRVR